MGIDELRSLWDAQADEYNQWYELGSEEIVAWAQKQVLLRAAERFAGDDRARLIKMANEYEVTK